ncbi:MAG: hypothetical protein EOO20_25045 [Chryseobacterium sp.]|nr:MAG: hypothetical protein EOO20_25045 [Chryseobacterium sp.]
MYKIIFWVSLVILIVGITYLFYGQHSEYYFADEKLGALLLKVLAVVSPLALIGSLFGTLKEHYTPKMKVGMISVTVFLAVVLALFNLALSLEPHTVYWTDYRTVYTEKSDSNSIIIEQLSSEIGLSNEPSSRYVQVVRVNFLFQRRHIITLEKIDFDKWNLVH